MGEGFSPNKNFAKNHGKRQDGGARQLPVGQSGVPVVTKALREDSAQKKDEA